MNSFFSGGSEKFIFLCVLLAALTLTILPVPSELADVYPHFLLLFVLSWILLLPYRLNGGFAWICGLFMDNLQGVLEGENALCFLVLGYVIAKFQRFIERSNGFIQTGIVFIASFIYNVLLFWLESLQGHSLSIRWVIINALGNAAVWMPFFLLLKKIKQKYF